MDLFLNPWYMVAGGAMVSSPIIIHLINRMRFRRIRWAAMEFLLKSQKRNRRRLIIEQLILLLLRCLLVLLAAFLVARFVGSALGLTQNSANAHIVILDDTLSMQDKWEDQPNVSITSFEKAKESLVELARHASEQSAAHYFEVYTLSQKDPIFSRARMNDETVTKLRQALEDVKPSFMHKDPGEGIERARKKLGDVTEGRRYVHIFSDFRERDWANGPRANDVKKSLDVLAENGVNITLVDTAYPFRRGKQPPLNNDNMAIIGLTPESRVAPEGRPVKVTVEIANYGSTAMDSLFLEVYLDDAETWNPEFSRLVTPPQPGQTIQHSFEVRFNSTGYHYLTTKLQLKEKKGLDADNTRYAVVEVRKKVPVLVIDGAPEVANDIGSDTRSIINVLESAKRYQVFTEGVEALDKPDLSRQYTTIYLLNVPRIEGEKGTPSENRLPNLKTFVQNGGNIVFFMGDKIDKDFYNSVLYEREKGFFPVPLASRKSPPIPPEKLESFSLQPKLYVRSKEHTLTQGIFPEQTQFAFLTIRHYSPTLERFNWRPELSGEEQLTELITLPNNKPLNDFKAQTQLLLGQIPQDLNTLKTRAKGLYAQEEKDKQDQSYEDLFEALGEHQANVIKALEGRDDELYLLADAIEAMLNDQGNPDQNKPNLTKFWDFPTIKDLKARLEAFYREVKYGYPLVLDRKYGKGHVVAFLTTAGSQWHNWPGGSPVSYTYPMVMADLVRYLTSGGEVADTFVGTELTFELDETRFKNEIERFKQLKQQDGARNPDAINGFIPAGKQQGVAKDKKFLFTFGDNRDLGVRFFRYERQEEGEDPEERWYAFNVDTASESDLRRSQYADLVRNPPEIPPERGRITLVSIGTRDVTSLLKRQHTDWSESPWLYLFFLIILIIEQALAVHLSFHLKGGEQGGSASTPASATPSEGAAVAA